MIICLMQCGYEKENFKSKSNNKEQTDWHKNGTNWKLRFFDNQSTQLNNPKQVQNLPDTLKSRNSSSK